MKNFSLSFLSKPVFWVCLVIFLTVVVPFFYVNNRLQNSHDAIVAQLNALEDLKVSFQDVLYIPPNYIIFKNLKVVSGHGREYPSSAVIKRVRLVFPLGTLLRTRELLFTRVYITQPEISGLTILLKGKVEDLVTFLNKLSTTQRLALIVKQALVVIPRKDAEPLSGRLNGEFTLGTNKLLTASGTIDIHYQNDNTRQHFLETRQRPIGYSFEGFLTDQGLSVERFHVHNKRLYAKLWGALERATLRLNGVVYTDQLAKQVTSARSLFSLSLEKMRRLMSFMRNRRVPIVETGSYASDIYNVACLIEMPPGRLDIKSLRVFNQKMPLSMNGTVSFDPIPQIDVNITSFYNQQERLRFENPNAFKLLINGRLENNSFWGSCVLDFVRLVKKKILAQKLNIDFQGLSLKDKKNRRIQIDCKRAELVYRSGVSAHQLRLMDFSSLGRFAESDPALSVEFSTGLFDGQLQGQGRCTFNRFLFNLKLNEVTATYLDSLLPYFSSIKGKISGTIAYRSFPEVKTQGELWIKKGFLDNLLFFSWLADYFQIQSLRRIPFNSLVSDFLVTNQVAGLDKIALDSEQVGLYGYFRIEDNDFISSKLSLRLARPLLEESEKFKPLLKLLGPDIDSLDFRFQLSGLADSPNFKWLESEFKQRLQKRLPGFIERALERRIDIAIQSISEQ